jgi:hypothetical protein
MDNAIPTARCLCWTDSFVDARDEISGIINPVEGRSPDFAVKS